jgi:hypothetical protein
MPSDSDIPPDGDCPPSRRVTPITHGDTFDTIPQGPRRNSNGDMSLFPTFTSTVGPPRTGSSAGPGPLPDKEGKIRQRVKNVLTAATKRLGTAVHNDESEFQRGKARDWVEIPGERNRNANFFETAELYNPLRDADGMATPVPPASQHSRAGSADSNAGASGSGARRASLSPGRASPLSSPPAAIVRRPHANTLPVILTASEREALADISPSAGPSRGRHQSLKVPPFSHETLLRNNSPDR